MNFNKNILAYYLKQLNKIQSYDSIVKERFDASNIKKYYKRLGYWYRRYHSPEGAMHFPIKINDSERHKDKLLFQARSVEQLVRNHHYKTIVELGCGQGFNSIYLAKQFPEVQFIAMDITEANLRVGERKGADLPNLTFKLLDFNQDEHNYKADLIFGIETFCYANNLTSLLRNLKNCLHLNGRIVIYDGFQNSILKEIKPDTDDDKAYRLLCWGFSLNEFQKLVQIQEAIKVNQLKTELSVDYSQETLPNYRVYQKGALRLLKYPLLTKFFMKLRILPPVILMHALSGIFGAYLVENEMMRYYQFVLVKRTEN